ncbi:hypothetical protein SO802_021381 [Lithocarpus litseifolius]|uniref:Serine aminopeptidase S33 domain-containing protein n=1 Tax=Lithocarpus litseifolius TaxID=425828 RepID=A0AAW2CEP9_9ROSI
MICYTSTSIVIPIETSIILVVVAKAKTPELHVRKRKLLEPPKCLCLSALKTRKTITQMAITTVNTHTHTTTMLTSGASGRVRALFSVRVWRSLVMVMNALLILLLVPFRRRRQKNEEGGSQSQSQKKVMVPVKMVTWRKSGSVVVEQEVAVRRALAMRRVAQDDDDDGLNEEVVRDYSLFLTPRGDTIFTRSWTPNNSNNIRGLVLIMHGLNEHSGRYNDFAKQLNANGYRVYGMDWIGHGGSDGLHAYVHSLDDAVNDMKSFLEKILAENPGLPCFCFGHSTGAAIVLKAMLDPKVEARVVGAVLTSPAVGVQASHPIFVVLAPIFSFLLPRYQISAANKQGTPVSRDPEALIAKYSDPLVYTGSIRVRTGYEILRITSYLQQNLRKLRVPFFVLHGTADTVTDPEASQKLYAEASSTDKTIKLFDGFLHDLLFEPEREAIMKDIIEWLNCRV